MSVWFWDLRRHETDDWPAIPPGCAASLLHHQQAEGAHWDLILWRGCPSPTLRLAADGAWCWQQPHRARYWHVRGPLTQGRGSIRSNRPGRCWLSRRGGKATLVFFDRREFAYYNGLFADGRTA